ncbi:hypothetical protein QAD02_002406 [Eretmocerus hayati]|uniref:Uncharacterized protein n=1 Tax=Eretmocerus hayati TaxID=131215 RepID=A0ACC2NJA0_9HYME|nr:hypothetical protein QAD02_002406 [Eretmocerus hayati]
MESSRELNAIEEEGLGILPQHRAFVIVITRESLGYAPPPPPTNSPNSPAPPGPLGPQVIVVPGTPARYYIESGWKTPELQALGRLAYYNLPQSPPIVDLTQEEYPKYIPGVFSSDEIIQIDETPSPPIKRLAGCRERLFH